MFDAPNMPSTARFRAGFPDAARDGTSAKSGKMTHPIPAARRRLDEKPRPERRTGRRTSMFAIMRPARRWILLTSAALAASVWLVRPARAQDIARNVAFLRRSVPAPRGAIEAQVGAGYNQGAGTLGEAPNADVQDVAGVGAGADLGVGYRVSPRLFVGGYGSLGLFTQVQPDTNVRSAAAGIQANWHFRPYQSLDPWISLGVGYRFFWESPPNAPTIVRNALVVPRFAVGVDYRFNRSTAIGPMVSADLSVFGAEEGEVNGSAGARIATFIFAGVAARFDLFGEPAHPAADVALR
jgi:outer membrane protein W